MKIISSREFRDNQAQYFDLADSKEQVIVQRGKNKSYRIVPISDDDYIVNIPQEHFCNPFDISPNGDMFWSDKRNVEALEKALKESEKDIAEGNVTICNTFEDSLKHLESL